MKRSLLIGLATLSLATVAAGQSTGANPTSLGVQSGAFTPAIVKAGEAIPIDGLRYRVLRVQSGLKEYVQRYDQQRMKFRPTFEGDLLVVIEFEVENVGDAATDPTSCGFKILDSEGGVSGFGLIDARLQSGVVAAGVPQDVRVKRSEIAPKGKAKMAMIFSVPPTARAKGLEVYQSSQVVSQGTVVQWTGPLLAKAELE